MANAYTDAGGGSSLGVNLVQDGYDKAVEFELRSQPLFRGFADKRVRELTNPGETIVLNIYNDFTESTPSALSETTDPDSVAVPSTSTVSVTVEELGETVIPTLKLRTLSFADIDPAVTNILARSQATGLDNKVQNVLRTKGTNVLYSNAGDIDATGPTNTLTSADVLKSAIPAGVVAKMRSDNVVERMGDTFVGLIHPFVAHDLKRESGEIGWNYPHATNATNNLWMARVGVFGGVSYIETPRCYSATDGASSAEVFRTYYLGAQALAEVVAIEPHTVIGLAVDPMMRKRPLSWYGMLGWNVFRQEALWRVETGSSLSSSF